MRANEWLLIHLIDSQAKRNDNGPRMLDRILFLLLETRIELNNEVPVQLLESQPLKVIIDVRSKPIGRAVIARARVVHEHLIPFPHDYLLLVRELRGRLEHHAIFIFFVEASTVPIVQVFILFGTVA